METLKVIAVVGRKTITNDPIFNHLQDQDDYWRKQGGRDERYTDGVSFRERLETTEGPR